MRKRKHHATLDNRKTVCGLDLKPDRIHAAHIAWHIGYFTKDPVDCKNCLRKIKP